MNKITCILKNEIEDFSSNREIDCQLLLRKYGEEGYIFLTIIGTTTNKLKECLDDFEKYDIKALPDDSTLLKLLLVAQYIVILGDYDIKGNETVTIRFRETADVGKEVNEHRKNSSTKAVKSERTI